MGPKKQDDSFSNARREVSHSKSADAMVVLSEYAHLAATLSRKLGYTLWTVWAL